MPLIYWSPKATESLAYRTMQSEAAHTLQDNNLDHGNSSEFITAWKCDLCLKEHLSEDTEKHQEMLQSQPGGRGSLPVRAHSVISIIQGLLQEQFSKNELQVGCIKQMPVRYVSEDASKWWQVRGLMGMWDTQKDSPVQIHVFSIWILALVFAYEGGSFITYMKIRCTHTHRAEWFCVVCICMYMLMCHCVCDFHTIVYLLIHSPTLLIAPHGVSVWVRVHNVHM